MLHPSGHVNNDGASRSNGIACVCYLTVDIDKRIWCIYEMEGLQTETMKTFDASRMILYREVLWTTVNWREIISNLLGADRRIKEGFCFPWIQLSLQSIGSVSSCDCLDAPEILATFTAGHTGLVACPWRHYNFNNYADNPHVDWINFIGSFFFVLSWEKAKCEKYFLKRLLKVWNFKRKTKSR